MRKYGDILIILNMGSKGLVYPKRNLFIFILSSASMSTYRHKAFLSCKRRKRKGIIWLIGLQRED